jgi:MerR family transcriptional regulator, thiopeptide resistance regulator
MTLTVSQVSKLSKVSVRTLHHYDDLGLLRPSARSEAGYRLYEERDLVRLQQILFYRGLEFSLDEIKEILSNPSFDLRAALFSQRHLLEEKIMRLTAILGAVDKNIQQLEEGHHMSKEEMFEIFEGFNPEEYEEEVAQRWCEAEAYKESKKRAAKYNKQDWQAIKEEAAAIGEKLAALLDAGAPADSVAAMNAAEEHRQHITRWFYSCSKVIHKGLGEMYVIDPRFTATFEKIRVGLAQYTSAAFIANAARS